MPDKKIKKTSKADNIFEDIAPLTFLDVETTGLSTQTGDRVCEIALLRVEKNGKITRWHNLIDPLRPISYGAQFVNKITDEMVSCAPKFRQVSEKLLKLIEGSTIVCHNACFDLNFLSMELAFCDLSLPVLPVIDTLRISRQHFSFPSNSLENIAKSLNIENKLKHRAMADVNTTYKVFRHFWTELKKRGICRLEEIAFQHF